MRGTHFTLLTTDEDTATSNLQFGRFAGAGVAKALSLDSGANPGLIRAYGLKTGPA